MIKRSKISILLNKGGIRKTAVFHNTEDASGFSGSLQLFLGDYEGRVGVLAFLRFLLSSQSMKFCFLLSFFLLSRDLR